MGKYARHHAVECIRDFLTPYMQQALQALSRDAPIDVARLFDDAGGTGSGGEASFKASKPLHLLVPHVRLYISIYIYVYVFMCIYVCIHAQTYVHTYMGRRGLRPFSPYTTYICMCV